MSKSVYVNLINRALPAHRKLAFPSISLFSGLLGIEIGLERAGFNTCLALDFDKDAKKVFDDNQSRFNKFPYLCQDILKTSPQEVLKEAGLKRGEVAILAGGPPCQPFSKSGLRKGVEDERGLLFRRYLDYINFIRPKSFLLENVRGMYSSRGGEDFRTILKDFEKSGYYVYWRILDAANYGVPQFRQRLFLIGFKDRIRFDWPVPTHGHSEASLFQQSRPYTTVREAIEDLADKSEGPSLTGRYAHLVADIPEGMNYSYYTAERNHPNPLFGWRSKFWYFLLKINRELPSLTIQAYPGNNTGPFHWKNRRLSIQELKRLQSLPAWLKIDTSYMTAHRLIGNCVPPILAEVLGDAIMAALERSQKISSVEYAGIRAENEKNGSYVKSGRGSGKGRRLMSDVIA